MSMLRHPFRHSQICVGMSASAGMSGRARTGLVFAGSQPDNEYLGCSHALAKGGAAQSQASRQSKLSTGIDEPPTLRAGGSWGLFGVA